MVRQRTAAGRRRDLGKLINDALLAASKAEPRFMPLAAVPIGTAPVPLPC